MTVHHLQGRDEIELLWYQRRSFLQAAAAWCAAGGVGAVQAQGRSNIVELKGDALVNGQRLYPTQLVQTGDEIVTGPDSTLIFSIGNSAFHVRQNSRLLVERGETLSAVSLLRLLQGAVVSVWGKGSNRKILTPTVTIGIRGTGVYTEMFANQNGPRTYFCDCYGTVDLVAGRERETLESTYHKAVWADSQGDGQFSLSPARAINHTDDELEYLARLVNQRTAWEISGQKGSKDHSDGGY